MKKQYKQKEGREFQIVETAKENDLWHIITVAIVATILLVAERH
jgi:hypothetical protein